MDKIKESARTTDVDIFKAFFALFNFFLYVFRGYVLHSQGKRRAFLLSPEWFGGVEQYDAFFRERRKLLDAAVTAAGGFDYPFIKSFVQHKRFPQKCVLRE